jgi:flagellar export protein FliJ
MKKFAFPLGRVMNYRRTQARLEEIKLEALYAELRAIDSREIALIAERAQAERSLRASESATGFELELYDSFRRSIREEVKKIDKIRAACRQRIDAQLLAVNAKRREVKLLEKLNEQRLAAWENEMAKEIDQQAEEAYLAKFGKRS